MDLFVVISILFSTKCEVNGYEFTVASTPDLAIPDDGSTALLNSISLTVPTECTGNVYLKSLFLDITHRFTGDLDINLYDNANVIDDVMIIADACSGSDDIYAHFSDCFAENTACPINGDYHIADLQEIFEIPLDLTVSSIWTIQVFDDSSSSDPGTLNEWSLTFVCGESLPCCIPEGQSGCNGNGGNNCCGDLQCNLDTNICSKNIAADCSHLDIDNYLGYCSTEFITLGDAINTLQINIDTNTAGITINTAATANNIAYITTNQVSISSNDVSIGTITTAVTSNTVVISDIEARLDAIADLPVLAQSEQYALDVTDNGGGLKQFFVQYESFIMVVLFISIIINLLNCIRIVSRKYIHGYTTVFKLNQ